MFNIKIGTISSKIHTPYEGMYQGGGTPTYTKEVTGNGYIDLTDAVANHLLELKAYGGTKQGGLPTEYTQLEYVVFDSTQVIDTGFTPNNNSRIESKCYRTGTECWFYGASPSNPRVTLYHSSTGTSRWGNQSLSNVGFAADTEYTLIEDKNGLTVNDTLYPWTSGVAGDFTCDRSLTIGNNNGSSGTRYFAGNFYYMKIYDNNVLVRHFVPCKNATNVVGLYDTVNDVFYTAAGLVEGTTVIPTPEAPMDIVCNNGILKLKDNELPTGYKRVKDIIFDGDTYYETNIQLTGADTTSFAINIGETGRNALGCYTGSGSGDNLSFYISLGSAGNYVRYKSNLYRPVLGNDKLGVDLSLSITPTGTLGFDTDVSWTQQTFTCPDNLYIGWLPNATSPKFIGAFKGAIVVDNRANFVPCERASDNAIGYYDTYSNTFYENQGTGTATTSGYDYSHNTIIYADGTTETIEDELGNTATAEMLLKVGDYADEQEILHGNIARKIGIKVLDGTESRVLATATNLVQFYITDTQGIIANNVSLVSTIAPYGCTVTNRTQYQFGCYSGSNGNLCFQMQGSSTLTTVDAFKQFLTAQFNAGTPVIVVYPLATPTTESAAGQSLNVQNGNNRIEITEGSILNLPLYAKYKSTTE